MECRLVWYGEVAVTVIVGAADAVESSASWKVLITCKVNCIVHKTDFVIICKSGCITNILVSYSNMLAIPCKAIACLSSSQ